MCFYTFLWIQHQEQKKKDIFTKLWRHKVTETNPDIPK